MKCYYPVVPFRVAQNSQYLHLKYRIYLKMKKNSSFVLIRFSILSISENKLDVAILPKIFTFCSE